MRVRQFTYTRLTGSVRSLNGLPDLSNPGDGVTRVSPQKCSQPLLHVGAAGMEVARHKQIMIWSNRCVCALLLPISVTLEDTGDCHWMSCVAGLFSTKQPACYRAPSYPPEYDVS